MRTTENRMQPLLLPTEAAEALAVKVNTLRMWRLRGDGPPFVKIGGSVRYRQADIEAFITAGVRQSTSQH